MDKASAWAWMTADYIMVTVDVEGKRTAAAALDISSARDLRDLLSAEIRRVEER